jgi:hypothetical protein
MKYIDIATPGPSKTLIAGWWYDKTTLEKRLTFPDLEQSGSELR